MLRAHYRRDGTYIYSDDDDEDCPDRADNPLQSIVCFEDFGRILSPYEHYPWVEQSLNEENLSTERPKTNLITIVDDLRRELNSQFGLGVFAEKSLRCIRGDYLYLQSL